MAQILDPTLEQRILDLEESVRSLRTAAAVGGTAIGARIPGAVTLTGTAGTPGGVGWVTDQGPSVDLYVAGARMRVDVGASLEVYGNKCSLYVGYQVLGPIDADDDQDPTVLLDAAAVLVPPDYEASASLQDDGTGMNQLGAFSTFDLIEGLDSGWYRVRAAYAISYSGTTGAPYGIATYRRLQVTRY